jgi:hypothetical protein
MTLLFSLILVATALNGMLAGGSLEASLVKLPARRRIGNIAYATFARGNDLGNGRVVYPVWAISATLLIFLATMVAFVTTQPLGRLLPLLLASGTSVCHFIATSQAAPTMLSLKSTPDDEAVLAAKLDRFERWHAVRTVFQLLTFFLMLWALVVAR